MVAEAGHVHASRLAGLARERGVRARRFWASAHTTGGRAARTWRTLIPFGTVTDLPSTVTVTVSDGGGEGGGGGGAAVVACVAGVDSSRAVAAPDWEGGGVAGER